MINVSRSTLHKKGFTLVEIALVVGIMVVLSSIVLVTLNIRGNRAVTNNVKRKIDLESIQGALDLRAQETGDSLPSGLSSGLSERCVGTGSDSFNLSSVSWSTSVGADIKFDVRSCDDVSCIGETWPGTPAFSSPPATIIGITNASYFQYKATFNAPELAWTQDTNADFNGTNSSTTVSGGSVKLNIDSGTGADGIAPVIGSVCAGLGVGGTYPNCTLTGATYNYSSFNIPSGVTVSVIGATSLVIKSQGNVTIDGTISLSGAAGANRTSAGTVAGGIGIAGGGNGGTGQAAGCDSQTGGQGVGPGGAGNGQASPGSNYSGYGGGGGGFGGGGGKGELYSSVQANGGASYGNSATSDILYGGSGGGGACSTGGDGNSGGAGGGALKIVSGGNIVINSAGIIRTNGGNGGVRSSGCCGWGTAGAGAGGGILLQTVGNITNNGTIQANGGAGGQTSSTSYSSGGGGAGGRIRLEASNASNITAGSIRTTSCTGGTGIEACGGTGPYDAEDGGAGSASSGIFTSPNLSYVSSGAYTSLSKNLIQPQTFTSISWNRTDSNDGEVTLGDTNLKGLWHLNETAGTNAPDSVGTNSGTIPASPNNPSWNSSGKFGYSLLFGIDDYVNILDNNAIDIGAGTEWSAGAWINLSGSGTRTIISKNDLYDMAINGAGQLTAGVYDPSDVDQVVAQSSNPVPADGQFHYVSFVFKKNRGDNNAEVKLYIDGKYDGNATISTAALSSGLSNSSNLTIGASANGFNGRIDEVSIWSKALTAPLIDCATNDPYNAQYDICKQYNGGSGLPHLKFQARSCNDSACDPLLPTPSTEDFIGPDGTSSTYYNSIGSYGSNSPLNLPANQWVQYKADFATSDTSKTPSLDAISIKYLSSSKPQLLDVTIFGTSVAFGNSSNFTHTTYNNFIGGTYNQSEFTIRDSANPSDSASGLVEYKGGIGVSYASPIFSGACYNLATDLTPLYLGSIPKDPKTGTDENTGYLISVDPATKVVCVKAPGAENDEVIENCRK